MLKQFLNNNIIEAGCDESGRGCLAGPVFAAAVILPLSYNNKKINDSKLLSVTERENLRKEIEKCAIEWAVAYVDNVEIDKINILNASYKAMHLALSKLKSLPQFLLIDGNSFRKYKNIPHKCIIKGDRQFLSIASASIIAKTYRDKYMIELCKKHPEYNWKKNKGYATPFHKEAINKYGITPYHRKSFNLNYQLKITLPK